MNLLESLQSISDVKLIVSKTPCDHNKYRGIRSECIDSMMWGYKESTPFFEDYLARSFLPDEPIDIAVTYGCPFGMTIEKLKKENMTKVIADLAPHNIKISMEEHMKYTKSYPYPHLINPFLLELYLRHLRLADKVVVHSHSSAEYIMKEANLKELPEVIPHGTELPESTPEYPDEFIPSYFGAIGHDKGFIYLFNAIVLYPSEIKLLIGGRETQGIVLNDKIKKRFELMGYVEYLHDFYKKVSIYIQPSVVEGFGITPLEAMSYGRPVVVAEGAGVSELITDGHNGFVIPIRDVQAIIDKIQYFKDNPDEIKRMGLNARKTAEKYSWKIIRKNYIDLYKGVLCIS